MPKVRAPSACSQAFKGTKERPVFSILASGGRINSSLSECSHDTDQKYSSPFSRTLTNGSSAASLTAERKVSTVLLASSARRTVAAGNTSSDLNTSWKCKQTNSVSSGQRGSIHPCYCIIHKTSGLTTNWTGRRFSVRKKYLAAPGSLYSR